MNKVNDRVGAMLSANNEIVKLLGYGIYLGDKSCPRGPMGCTMEEWEESFRENGLPIQPYFNPCILLDSGRHVWGQQCWWGSEEKVKQSIGDRKVEIVEIEDLKPLD